MPKTEKRVQQNAWLSSEVKRDLEQQAILEERSPGALAGLLIAWALKQLHTVGNYVELKQLSVSPPSKK